MPLYPEITVKLTGTDGNAFAVLRKVLAALDRASLRQESIKEFSEEATSGDYDHLLRTCMKWVDVV